VSLWAERVAAEFGRDRKGGCDEFQQSLQPVIDRVNACTWKARAAKILDVLSHKVCAQEKLSYHIEECVSQNTFLMETQALIQEGGSASSIALPDPVHTISFLAQSLESESINSFCSQYGSGVPVEYTTAQQFHREYWGLSREEQITFIGNLLGSQSAGKIGRIIKPLLDDFLPIPSGSGTLMNPDANMIGKLISKFFIGRADSLQVATGVRALITAVHSDNSEPKSDSAGVRFGYRLGEFLSELGPGPTKVGQYGHSLPLTPEEWRAGLKTTKYDGKALTRAQEWRNLRSHVPQELLDALYLGMPCGTGAYLSTYDVKIDDGHRLASGQYEALSSDDELVISLLKANAKEDAERFISLVIDIANEIVNKSPEAEASVKPLKSLLQQGLSMIATETNLVLSKEQERIIHDILSKLEIEVDGKACQQRAANAFEVGEGFRTSIKIHGPHFNELIRCRSDASFKHQLMKSIKVEPGDELDPMLFFALHALTGQSFVWASGQEAGHDRHGNNFACQPDGVLGHFDPGARALTPPTQEQLQSMMNVLIDAGLNSLRNKYGFPSSLKHTLKKVDDRIQQGEENSDLSYLYDSQRMILAWGDMAKVLKASHMIEIGAAILESGKVHPVILKTLTERLVMAGVVELKERLSRNRLGQSVVQVAKYGARFWPLKGLASLVQEEKTRRAIYYPHNPKPKRVRELKASDAVQPRSHLKNTFEMASRKVRVAKPPRVRIKDTRVPATAIGRAFGLLAPGVRSIRYFLTEVEG
ncbi:MAG: hypothetical protein KDD60_01410, partial [Bdellovibrionales bacterium]|nr:hypothetical protein [Bdellovibrionales bacterium]